MASNGGLSAAASLVDVAVRAAVASGAPRRTVAATAAAVASAVMAAQHGSGGEVGEAEAPTSKATRKRRRRRNRERQDDVDLAVTDAQIDGVNGQTLEAQTGGDAPPGPYTNEPASMAPPPQPRRLTFAAIDNHNVDGTVVPAGVGPDISMPLSIWNEGDSDIVSARTLGRPSSGSPSPPQSPNPELRGRVIATFSSTSRGATPRPKQKGRGRGA